MEHLPEICSIGMNLDNFIYSHSGYGRQGYSTTRKNIHHVKKIISETKCIFILKKEEYLSMFLCVFVPKDLMDLFHSEVPNLILFEQQEISSIERNHHFPEEKELESILLFF